MKASEVFPKNTQASKQQDKDKEENLSYQFQISDDKKKDICKIIKEYLQQSEASRSQWLEIRKESINQYEGIKEPSNEPWEDHCFSRDTDILTERGWINIVELKEDDFVYSMNPDDKEAYYMPVIRLIRYYHSRMIHFKGKSIDLVVSPEHKMVVETKNSSKGLFREARQIHGSGSGLYIPLVSDFRHYKEIDEIYGFNARDWVSFLGWYISEGFTYSSGTIGICQRKSVNSEKCAEIEFLLNRMGIEWSYNKEQYLVSCKKLSQEARNELRSLGKSDAKYIPRKYLSYSPSLLAMLFETMMKGDGCVRKRGGNLARAYYTISPRLADDVQELLQKIGLRGRINRRKASSKQFGRRQLYAIEVCNKDRIQCAKLSSQEVEYNDFAYCLTTPFHTVYVRRNGIAVWSGNSNISTMVTTVACDLLHSKIFPMVWNEKSISWEGTEEHDNEIANINKTVMSYVTGTDMKMQDKIDDIVHRLIVDGTIAIKLAWKPYYKWVTRKEPIITPESLYNQKLNYKVSYDYIRDERCEMDVRDIERVYIPYYSESTDPRWEDGAEYILDERWYTLADLREMQLDGLIDESVSLDKLGYTGEVPQSVGTQSARTAAEGSSVPFDELPQSFKHRCIEAYIKYDINNDKRREECVFLVIPEYDIYLSGKALQCVSRIGRRPWIIRPFLRRPGRAYGKGVPELVRHLHKELDAIHNQRIDAGNRVIGGGGFYRPASGTNPRRLKMGPATWVPVDDPQKDIYSPSYNMSGLSWSANEERLVMELIERLTYLTPAMLGRETASRPTARGTIAVIQQGEQKFGLIGARVQKIFCDLLTDIRQKYEENMPPAKWERIIGKKMLRDWPSVEYMVGNYEAKMQLDLTASDPEAERAIASLVYQTMAFDPMVNQNPAFMWEVRADYLRAHRREPVEKYIGPRPPTTANPKDVDDIFTLIEQEQKPPMEGDPATLLPGLMELKKSERYQKFSPVAKAIFNDYIRKLQMGYIDNITQKMEMMNAGSQFGAPQGPQNLQGLRNLSPQLPRAIPGATGGTPGVMSEE